MPSTYFSQIIGHQTAKQHLDHLVDNNKIPQALLLAGPSQIGKTAILTRLAQILQCNEQGCTTCATCEQVKAQTQINTHFFTNPGNFKIATIRELQEQAHLTSTSNYHIFIIKGIERFTIQASNAFLKLLEEPPGSVYFFLTTNNEIDLLPTIRSRCQTLKLNNLTNQDLTTFAQKHLPDTNITNLHLELSLGKPGRLQELINNEDRFNQLKEWYQKITDVDNFPLSHQHFLLTKEISGLDRPDIVEFLTTYQIFVRNQIQQNNLNKQLWSHKLKVIQTTINNVNSNFNSQLSLENLFLTTTKA